MQKSVFSQTVVCYLGDPSARGAALIWSIFHEQSQLRVGLVSSSCALKYLLSVAYFMSIEKEEREDEKDERQIAGEGADVKKEKQQSHCVSGLLSQ